MDYVEILKIGLQIAVPIVVGVAAGVGGAYYLLFKKKLSKFRKFVDSLDDAIYDDAVTEAEFRDSWDKFFDLIKN